MILIFTEVWFYSFHVSRIILYMYYSFGAIALSYPPRVRVRATAKLSTAFFHDESSITMGGEGGGGV